MSLVLLCLLCAEPDYRGLAATSLAVAAMKNVEQPEVVNESRSSGSPAGENAPAPQPVHESRCVLFFSAGWCGWCHKMEREMKGIVVKRYDLSAGDAHVWLVDPTLTNLTASEKALHQSQFDRYEVTALPTSILIVNGKVVARHEGYMSPDEFKAFRAKGKP